MPNEVECYNELFKWKQQKKAKYEELDGLDAAYFKGVDVVLKELAYWDGGISESYLEGILDAITTLEAITEGEDG